MRRAFDVLQQAFFIRDGDNEKKYLKISALYIINAILENMEV